MTEDRDNLINTNNMKRACHDVGTKMTPNLRKERIKMQFFSSKWHHVDVIQDIILFFEMACIM